MLFSANVLILQLLLIEIHLYALSDVQEAVELEDEITVRINCFPTFCNDIVHVCLHV